MTVEELIQSLQELPEECRHREVFCTYDTDCGIVGIMGLYKNNKWNYENGIILEGDS